MPKANIFNKIMVQDATFKIYILGFIISLVLTSLSFAFVVFGAFPKDTLWFTLGLSAILQIVTQLRCFIHIRPFTKEQRWKWVMIYYTAIVLFILISLSLFIMFSLMHNTKM